MTKLFRPARFTALLGCACSILSYAGVAFFYAAEPATKPSATPDLGVNADLHGKPVFPADNAWNKDISKLPVDPHSKVIIDRIGADKPLHPDFGERNGIPYQVVAGTQAKVKIEFTAYGDESDPGPYPVPADAPVEGGLASDGDRHVLVLDRDHWILYELFRAFPAEKDGLKYWKAASGATWDLTKNSTRPAGWTSADAAGLPVFSGLVRYDEAITRGEINHAIRFTVQKSRRAYVAPASHFASSNNAEDLPPMGAHMRLRADFDIKGYPKSVQPILTALKKYGMILADNGSDWFITGVPNPKWNDDELHALTKVKGRDFEMVQMK